MRCWQLWISARGHRKRRRLMASTSGFPRLCAHSCTDRGSVESHGAVWGQETPRHSPGDSPWPPSHPIPRDLLPFPRQELALHPGHAVPAQPEVSAWFPSSQRTWGKQRAEALLRGRGAPSRVREHRVPKVGSHILRSRAQLGTRGSPQPARASPALNVLLFGG